jgi:hypothetical protein
MQNSSPTASSDKEDFGLTRPSSILENHPKLSVDLPTPPCRIILPPFPTAIQPRFHGSVSKDNIASSKTFLGYASAPNDTRSYTTIALFRGTRISNGSNTESDYNLSRPGSVLENHPKLDPEPPTTPRHRDVSSPPFIAALQPCITLVNNGSVARDHLSSERTFLAYVRTSLMFASAGVGEFLSFSFFSVFLGIESLIVLYSTRSIVYDVSWTVVRSNTLPTSSTYPRLHTASRCSLCINCYHSHAHRCVHPFTTSSTSYLFYIHTAPHRHNTLFHNPILPPQRPLPSREDSDFGDEWGVGSVGGGYVGNFNGGVGMLVEGE